MVVYFVFQEIPISSIYKTQIIDVVNYLKTSSNQDVRFLTLIPATNFFKYRAALKKDLQVKSYILPQLPFPKMYGWKLNLVIVWLFAVLIAPKTVICRGPFGCWLSLKNKKISPLKRVVFDSRGLVTEEAKEYGVYPDHIKKTIRNIEQYCVKTCDFMMVITQGMTDYYSKFFGYNKNNYVVIPCTLGREFELISFTHVNLNKIRLELGYSNEDVLIVYSGSNAKWQSFDVMLDFADRILLANKRAKLLLLTKENDETRKIMQKWPERVTCKWLNGPGLVQHLVACDYALMIRESSVTNKVSSPTKFAEYMAAGLKVIASDTMAISDIVRDNSVGYLIDNKENIDFSLLDNVNLKEKQRLHDFSVDIFSKSSQRQSVRYKKILQESE